MKTQDIKNMASAYMQVLEKAKMDKVNPKALEKDFDDREDKDIDNDGKVDSSDEYLHNRRKAIKQAMKKEEVEELDEIGDTAAGKKKLKNLIVNRTQKAVDAGASLERRPEKAAEYDRAQKRHMKTIGRAATRLAKEEVEELDELSKKTLGNYVKKATGDAVTKAYKAGDVRDKDTTKNYMKALGRQIGISKATNKLTKEEVEELDELSQDKLQSYHAKAALDLRKKREKLDKGTLTMKDLKKGQNRVTGLNRAANKMEEVELDEISRDTARSYIRKATAPKTTGEMPKKDRTSGIEMAGKKAYGIGGKAKVNATESVDLDEDISKMSHGRLKWHMNTGTPHGSYSKDEMKAERDRRMKYRDSADAYKKAKPGLSEAKDGDGVNIVRDREFKEPKFKFKSHPYGSPEWHANKAAYDKFKAQQAAKKAMKKEEVEIDEAAPKIKSDFVKTQREKDREHDAAMGRTPTGRKKTMTSTQRSMASMRKEDTEMSMKEKLQLQKESILEREMTDAEKKKREDIVMGMKKNKADLEKRYGSRWKDVMYATATKQAMESADNALAMTKNLLTTKEDFKTENTTWPVYARIKEANDRAMHYRGATPPETMDDKMTASDKAFINPHGGLKGTDSGIDGAKAAEYTAKHATDGIKPGGGMNRTGDQKTGDKNIIKSTEAK